MPVLAVLTWPGSRPWAAVRHRYRAAACGDEGAGPPAPQRLLDVAGHRPPPGLAAQYSPPSL